MGNSSAFSRGFLTTIEKSCGHVFDAVWRISAPTFFRRPWRCQQSGEGADTNEQRFPTIIASRFNY